MLRRRSATVGAAYASAVFLGGDSTMMRYLWRTALFLGLGCAGPLGGVGEPEQKSSALSVKLGKVPDLRLAPRRPVAQDQAKRIRDLIASLAALDKPDFGLSS